MVTDPPQNPQTEAWSSDDRGKEMDVSGGQMSLKITFDKQTPEEVKRGIWSQALFASIRSHRSAIGSIDLGLDMNPDVANVIDDILMKAAMVINTVADVGSLGSDFLNWSTQDNIAIQGDSNKIVSQTDVDVNIIPVQSTSDKLTALSSDSSESSFDLLILQSLYAEILCDEYTSEFRYLNRWCCTIVGQEKCDFSMKQAKNATCTTKQLTIWR